MSSAKAANRRSTRGEYIETDTGNKVSRRSRIEGTQHIILAGRVVVCADACLRGDLVRPLDAISSQPAQPSSKPTQPQSRTSISIGRYTVLAPGCTLHPPHRVYRGESLYYPLKIGEHVFIGPGSFISAATIGSHVWVGAGVMLENGVVVRDGVRILDSAVVSAGTVIPSGVVVGGRPARIIGEVSDGFGVAAPYLREGEWVAGGELRELVRSVR